MPLDFALYIMATIVATSALCIAVVAGIGWVIRKVRARRARRVAAAEAAAYAAMGLAGGYYIGEGDGLTDVDIDRILGECGDRDGRQS